MNRKKIIPSFCSFLVSLLITFNAAHATTVGKIVLSTDVGATVSINNVPIGTASKDEFKINNVAVGKCSIKISKTGYSDSINNVLIQANKTTNLGTITLVSSFVSSLGTVQISSTPVGAAVIIGSVSKGLTPLTLQLNPGTYSVRLTKDGYQIWNGSVAVTRGGQSKISQTLTAIPRSGSLSVTSVPAGAKFYLILEDVLSEVGTTPMNTVINPRTYGVSLQMPGYQPWWGSVVVTPGNQSNISQILTPVPASTTPAPAPAPQTPAPAPAPAPAPQHASSSPPGTLLVVTSPAGAQVKMDGGVIGITQADTGLAVVAASAVVHNFEISRAGYLTKNFSDSVASGATKNIATTLEIDPASDLVVLRELTLGSLPQGADIFLNGQPLNIKTPATITLPTPPNQLWELKLKLGQKEIKRMIKFCEPLNTTDATCVQQNAICVRDIRDASFVHGDCKE